MNPPAGPKSAAQRGRSKPTTNKPANHKWEFKARFRRHAFGWRSQPAIHRIKQAANEIKRVSRTDALLGAEGAVLFIERLSPALEHVDSSSGAIGTAVNNAIHELVPFVANAPADAKTRDAWLERLWQAHADDQIPYIERLGDYWGELCASASIASAWADRLIGVVRMAWSPDPKLRGHFHGTSACLSALFAAGRYEELVALIELDTLGWWPHQRWAVKALAAMGKKAEAIRYAESCRSDWASDSSIDALCEEILFSSGLVEEAYARYGLSANRGSSYLATYRAIAKKYPQKKPSDILNDLVKRTPADEGKWFAAAKNAGLYAEAIELANRSPCDPKTLIRAARDYAEELPAFAVAAGMAALRWLVEGFGYEITGADVWAAYDATMAAAERAASVAATKARIRDLVAGEVTGDRLVTRMLGRELGLD
jgi:hypothetical protein